jgi:hypothetical protein
MAALVKARPVGPYGLVLIRSENMLTARRPHLSHLSFIDLGVPARLVAVLAARDITHPFPIQTATLPDALGGATLSARAGPDPARRTPSCCHSSPGSARGRPLAGPAVPAH